MAWSGYGLCAAVVVILSGGAGAQVRPPPPTDDAIVVPDGSQSWIPAERKAREPLTYDAPRTPADPDASVASDEAMSADSLTAQCGPVVHMLAFGEVLADAQELLRLGKFADVITMTAKAEALAVGANEKVTVAALRITAYRKMGDTQGVLTSLERFLALACGLPPEMRSAFAADVQRLRDELK